MEIRISRIGIPLQNKSPKELYFKGAVVDYLKSRKREQQNKLFYLPGHSAEGRPAVDKGEGIPAFGKEQTVEC